MATPELQKPRMAYVRFEKRPIENRTLSMSKGHYVTTDVDFAIITPTGSKDTVIRRVDEWFVYLDQQVVEERVPPEWVEKYKMAYEKFKKGEEIPLDGTAIKGWPVLSPAQQQNLIALGIRTVEDLAQINQEAIARIGMGAMALKEKAKNWLEAANNVGKLAERMTAFELQLGEMSERNRTLEDQNRLLRQKLEEVQQVKAVA